MVGLIIRVALLMAAVITGLFVAQDADSFGTVQMAVALLLFAVFVAAAAFGPALLAKARRRR